MEKCRAIPSGFMTVGEIAKKMGVSVRTLQYYDKEKLITPSAESDGGRRLYSDKDMIKLHQVLSMKSLGFSLDEIKNKLILLDTPSEVAAVLANQADFIKQKITALTESLRAIEALRDEVVQMQIVDFKKYADIVVNLQMKNEYYRLIKHFDDKTLDHIRKKFTQESGKVFMQKFQILWRQAINLQKDGVSASSKEGQDFAANFWNMITEFTDGDMSLVSGLMDFAKKSGEGNAQWRQEQEQANVFIEPALEIYFDDLKLKSQMEVKNEFCYTSRKFEKKL